MNARAGYSGKINIQICITGRRQGEYACCDLYDLPTYFFRLELSARRSLEEINFVKSPILRY